MVYREPLTVGQAANICSVCKKSVLNWIYGGALKAFTTHGGHYRIWPANLRTFLDASGMDVPFVSMDVRSTHVVIIDDNRSYAGMLGDLIVDELPGVEASIAENGHEGLVLIGELQPRLVVLDMNMPGLNGMGILSLLKKRKVQHPMNVLVLSGFLDSHTKHQALALGADHAMDKLSDINIILQAIASLTGRGKQVPVEEIQRSVHHQQNVEEGGFAH